MFLAALKSNSQQQLSHKYSIFFHRKATIKMLYYHHMIPYVSNTVYENKQCVLNPQHRATSPGKVLRRNKIYALNFTEKEHLLPFFQL